MAPFEGTIIIICCSKRPTSPMALLLWKPRYSHARGLQLKRALNLMIGECWSVKSFGKPNCVLSPFSEATG